MTIRNLSKISGSVDLIRLSFFIAESVLRIARDPFPHGIVSISADMFDSIKLLKLVEKVHSQRKF